MTTLATSKLGNWTDEPCFYVSVTDAGRLGLLLGPFRDEAACREWAYRDAADGGNARKHAKIHELAEQHDERAHFYGFGMVKMANGYRAGLFSAALGMEGPDCELRD